MNDSYPQNAARPTLCEIFEHQRFHLARLKRVQVQHAINRQLNRFVVHSFIQARRASGFHIQENFPQTVFDLPTVR